MITNWTGRAVEEVDRGIRCPRHLFEKTGLAMTADGSDGHLVNIFNPEGVPQDTYSFMHVETTPEPLQDDLPISPSAATRSTRRVQAMRRKTRKRWQALGAGEAK